MRASTHPGPDLEYKWRRLHGFHEQNRAGDGREQMLDQSSTSTQQRTVPTDGDHTDVAALGFPQQRRGYIASEQRDIGDATALLGACARYSSTHDFGKLLRILVIRRIGVRNGRLQPGSALRIVEHVRDAHIQREIVREGDRHPGRWTDLSFGAQRNQYLRPGKALAIGLGQEQYGSVVLFQNRTGYVADVAETR